MLTATDQRVNLIVDSGAYTAWTKGKIIDLPQYIRFCRDNEEHIEKAVSLDVIPGRPRKPRTPAQTRESAMQGWANLLRMRAAGVDAMPVFHYGEPRCYLDRMAAESSWIGLSSGSRLSGLARYVWIDTAFTRLCRRGEFPRIRVHGFSETRPGVLLQYPWYSVDSATWVKCAAYSQVFLPTLVAGMTTLGLLFVGPFNGGTQHATRHFDSQSEPTKWRIRERFESHGFTVEQLSGVNGAYYRSAYNAHVQDRMVRAHALPPFVHGFGARLGEGASSAPVNRRVRLYAATNLGPTGSGPLDYACIRDRLISFAFVPNGSTRLGPYVNESLRGTTPLPRGGLC